MRILPITNITFKASANPKKVSKKPKVEESYAEKHKKAEEKYNEELKRKQEEWVILIHRPQTYNKDK